MNKQNPKNPTGDNRLDENRLIAERREKLHVLKAETIAYPNDFRPNTNAAVLHQRFVDDDTETLAEVDETFALAGRMLAKRVMGKIAFVKIQDGTGTMQFVVQRDNLPEGLYMQFKQWDIGDIIAGTGAIFRTQKGELSIKPTELRLLTKSLRPLPELPSALCRPDHERGIKKGLPHSLKNHPFHP